MSPTRDKSHTDRDSNIFWEVTRNIGFQLAVVAVLVICLMTMSGCQTLKNMAGEMGQVVAGQDLGEPGPDTAAEQIVAGVEAAKPLLPFPVSVALAAIFSGLDVYTVASNKKKESK